MTLSTAADDRRHARRGPAEGNAARDHVNALAGVVEDLAGQFDLRPLLGRILWHAADLLGCDSGSICTVDQKAGAYRKEVDLGVSCRSGAQFPLTEGVTGEIMRAGGPVTFTEYADVRGGHIATAERAALHATIGVPIRWSGSVIGTCIVFSRDRGRRFAGDDVTLLELFAGHAGLAMVNARLHTRAAELTRAEAAGLERERVVRDVHDSVARALASVVPHPDSAGAGGALDAARQGARIALREGDFPLQEGRSGTPADDLADATGVSTIGPAGHLEAALQAEVDFARAAGLDIRLVVAGPRRPLPAVIAGELLALGRQAVANIVAHADARTARVGLVFGAVQVVLFAQDDGVGFDVDELPRPDGSRVGLRGPGLPELTDIAAGTRLLGGGVQIDATPGWGTTIRAAIPYPVTEPAAGQVPHPVRRIRTLVVEHRPLVSAGVMSLLQGADQHVSVVGSTVGEMDTLAAVALLKPDVVLIDAALPAGAAALTGQIRARGGGAVIALGERDRAESSVRAMMRSGASGVVLLHAAGTDFTDAITSAVVAEKAAAAAESPEVRPSSRPDKAARQVDLLTPREQEVRALLSKGMPDKAIAATLNISVKTVEKHVGAALRKTGTRNRTELAALGRSEHDTG